MAKQRRRKFDVDWDRGPKDQKILLEVSKTYGDKMRELEEKDRREGRTLRPSCPDFVFTR